MVDWSQLPYELVELIANKLHAIEDFVSFSAVCRSWRFVYRNEDWTPTRRVPWLMVNENHGSEVCTRRFISMWKNKSYKLPLPMAHGRRCWGSTHGWIVTVDQNLVISLLNPVSQVCFDLPPHSTLDYQFQSLQLIVDWFSFILKAAVFKIRGVFVTMIIYGQDYRLALHRHHEGSSWLTVPSSYIHFIDVVCFGNQVFALSVTGGLYLVKIDGPDPPRIIFISSSLPLPDQNGWLQKHLVHSAGQLLLIFHNPCLSSVLKFKVYWFDFNANTWEVLQSLGECALFVDDSHFFSISAGDDFKSNSIYFAMDTLQWFWGVKDDWDYCGVYHMEDDTIERFSLKMPNMGEVFPHYICPTWLIPTLS